MPPQPLLCFFNFFPLEVAYFIFFSVISPLDGNVVSTHCRQTECIVSLCSFLIEDIYFDSCRQLNFRVVGRGVCARFPGSQSLLGIPFDVGMRLCTCKRVRIVTNKRRFHSRTRTFLLVRAFPDSRR